MERILISACLLGHAVRYNGGASDLAHPAVRRWQAEGRLVTICPEVTAGFSIPRPPAEIAEGRTGEDVLDRAAKVIELGGADVTALFLEGARAALALAVKMAAGSPCSRRAAPPAAAASSMTAVFQDAGIPAMA